jgi:uncharacterized protein
MIRIEFDPVKDVANQVKHGVALAIAEFADWPVAMARFDTRFDYREARVVALVPVEDTVYDIVFVDRGSVRRIISVRRANRREAEHYVRFRKAAFDPDSHR